ncbi:unnamed protein product [Caenorhabditis nigoni]
MMGKVNGGSQFSQQKNAGVFLTFRILCIQISAKRFGASCESMRLFWLWSISQVCCERKLNRSVLWLWKKTINGAQKLFWSIVAMKQDYLWTMVDKSRS